MILDPWSQEKSKENLPEINPKLPFALMLPEDKDSHYKHLDWASGKMIHAP